MSGKSSKLSLLSVLLLAAILELIFNRITGRLVQREVVAPTVMKVLDRIGLYLFNFLSLLSTLTLLFILFKIAAGWTRFKGGARLSLPAVGLVSALISVYGVFVRLSPRGLFHMRIGFIFLLMLCCLAGLAGRASWRVKMGTVLAFVPIALQFWAFMRQLMEPDASRLEVVAAWSLAAKIALISMGALSIVFFTPRRGHFWFAGIVAAAVTLSWGLLVRLDWDLANRFAGYGFGFDLPASPLWSLVFVLAFGCFIFTCVSLLLSPGSDRMRGYGLALIGSMGLNQDLPYQVAVVSLGFYCLADSGQRELRVTFSRERLVAIMQEIAALLQAPQVVITGRPGYEVAQAHAPATAAKPVHVRVALNDQSVREVEVIVGDPALRDPPLVVCRRSESRLGIKSQSPLVQVGDDAFDGAFQVRDRRSAGIPLLDDETRRRLQTLLNGWIGVWPQSGLRYRASELPENDLLFPMLLELLVALPQRTPRATNGASA